MNLYPFYKRLLSCHICKLSQTAGKKLANLIKTTIEASTSMKKITIVIDKEDIVSICINNKGIVPEKIKSRFFEKYVTCGKSSGTGLGTYSAKLIAETQNGQISLLRVRK